MIRVVFIPNAFDPKKDRTITEHKWSGKKLYEYIPAYLHEPTVALNQLHAKDFDVVVPDNSEIVIAPKQEISAIAGFVATTLFSATSLAAAGTLVTITSYAIGTAVMMAGSMLLSSVLAPSSQQPNGATQSISESPTYSWSPTQTLPRAGSPIPVLYGKHQLAGNVIQRRIEYVGDDEYLYLQLALCMGEIEDIYDGNILINDTPIIEYEDLEWHFTNGTMTQDVMPYFGDIETPNSFSTTLENLPIVRQTIGNASESLRLFLQFPEGIYYSNDNGGLDSRSVEFKIEYKNKLDSIWITLQQEDKRFDHWEYENRYTRTTYSDEGGETTSCNYWVAPYWSTSKTQCYTGKRRAIYATSIFDTYIFGGAKTTPINREIRIDNLAPGEYEVRITRLTSVSTNPREKTKCNWVGIGEIIKDDLAYPSVALLGLRIKATGQLSGDVNVKTLCERSEIEVFNETGISQGLKRLDNPAWIYWDMLTNKIYGYGLSYAQIDFDAINEWALWCDELVSNGIDGQAEKRAVFNGVFDFEGNLWDSLTKVCTVGRASPIIRGTKYSVVVDKASPMVQIFNMGNIKKSSLKISYIGEEELANEVEVQFINKDKDYTNDTISVVVPEWFDDTQIKKSTVQQIGITNLSQAYRAGRYFLNCNKHIKRTAEFEVGIDAIDSEVGDVIGISHDVPAWGESGRVVSAVSNAVVLDKEVILADGNAYEITVRLNDNSFEKFDVLFAGTQTTSNISINGSFATTPSQYDVYSIVEKPHVIKLFRINSITRKTDQTRKIVAVEYNESIVSDATTIVEITSASELNLHPKVIDFKISEHLDKRKDGSIVPYLDFSWDIDENIDSGILYDIYIEHSRVVRSTWWGNKTIKYYQVLKRDIKRKSYSYQALYVRENKEYTYKIVARAYGVKSSVFTAGTTSLYTLKGKSELPESVTNIQASWLNGSLIISWDENKDVDFDCYEIDIQGQLYRTTINSLKIDNLGAGDYNLIAYAIDTSRNKSIATLYNLHVTKPCMIYMIRDAYLIEKAFIDGAMTIYTSLIAPSSPNKYDIWKVSTANITLEEFEYGSEILTGVAWDVGSTVELYKYWTGNDWLLCTTEQTAVIRRMLGQLVSAGIADNEVKIFNIQPYTPYEVNDLWIDGTTIMICTNSRLSGVFDFTDWAVHNKEDITIATKLENIKG